MLVTIIFSHNISYNFFLRIVKSLDCVFQEDPLLLQYPFPVCLESLSKPASVQQLVFYDFYCNRCNRGRPYRFNLYCSPFNMKQKIHHHELSEDIPKYLGFVPVGLVLCNSAIQLGQRSSLRDCKLTLPDTVFNLINV